VIANQSTVDRDKAVGDVQEKIEVDLILAGCSAIEDKLQVNVGPTIRDIKKAGVNVWVLTGDKVETAINIGQSCQLLTKSQNWFVLEGKTPLELNTDIHKRNAQQKYSANKTAVIVDGFQLSLIQSQEELQAAFVDLCTFERVEVVLCCRVSPQ